MLMTEDIMVTVVGEGSTTRYDDLEDDTGEVVSSTVDTITVVIGGMVTVAVRSIVFTTVACSD